MKKNTRAKNDNGEKTPKPRTVKIADDLHHKVRMLAFEKRIPMQSFIEQSLAYALKAKAYENFAVTP